LNRCGPSKRLEPTSRLNARFSNAPAYYEFTAVTAGYSWFSI
jgi:hypothetical protein